MRCDMAPESPPDRSSGGSRKLFLASPRKFTGGISSRGNDLTRAPPRSMSRIHTLMPDAYNSIQRGWKPAQHFDDVRGKIMARTIPRSATAPLSEFPDRGILSRDEAARRIEERRRSGNKLDAWGCKPLEEYRSILPYTQMSAIKGSMLPHPGLLLPQPLTSSQCLFGPGPNRSGVPSTLRSVATSMPTNAPRFMTRDSVACRSSTHACFRKTSVSCGAQSTNEYASEQTDAFRKPGTPFRRQSNFGARGILTETYGRTYESSGFQPWCANKR